MVVKEVDELTPVENHKGLYIKRDDLYRPFEDMTVNGGKLRQCYKLVDSIKDKYSGVISCCSIDSPQGPITSAVAKHFNLKAIIGYGGKQYNLENKFEMPMLAKSYGADVRALSTSGRHSILYSYAKKIAKEENLFVVEYGFNIIDHPDIMFSAVSRQVENIPDELDNLVVTCGSGITTTGILLGLYKYKKKVKNIYLVATAPNREKLINENLSANNINMEYTIIDLFHNKDFKYEKKLYKTFDSIELHPNYEAKTFDWLENNINYTKEKTLLWIVGAEPKIL